MRRSALLLAVVFALGQSAWAQDDDDDLAPLVPTKGKPAAKPKPKPKPKPAPAKPPPGKTTRPGGDDEDLAPLVATRTEVWVRPPAGMTGAVLFIDGKEVGPLPLPAQAVAPGEHQLMVKRKAYAVFVKKVTVAVGKTLEVQAAMQPVTALLTVRSDVPDAEVFVNGRLIGTVPIVDHEVPTSTIELEVRKDGFKEEKQRLAVVAGREYPVTVKMKGGSTTTLVAATDTPVDTTLVPSATSTDTDATTVTTSAGATPIYGRWYFWAGVAAVVAAGVGIGVAAGSGPPPPLREPEVCLDGRCDKCINFTCAATGVVPLGAGSGVVRF